MTALALLAGAASLRRADQPEAQFPEPSFRQARRVLAAGEELEYQLRWVGIGTGRATWQVKRRTKDRFGAEVFEVALEVRSNDLMHRFYKVREDAVCLIDAEGGYTRFFKVDAHLGHWRRIGQYEIEPLRRKALDELRAMDVDPHSREFPLQVSRRRRVRAIVARVVYRWYAATTGGGESRVARQSPQTLAQTFRGLIGCRPVYYLWRRKGASR